MIRVSSDLLFYALLKQPRILSYKKTLRYMSSSYSTLKMQKVKASLSLKERRVPHCSLSILSYAFSFRYVIAETELETSVFTTYNRYVNKGINRIWIRHNKISLMGKIMSDNKISFIKLVK